MIVARGNEPRSQLLQVIQFLALVSLRSAAAFASTLQSARVIYSGSGVTLPEVPKFNCDKNKTLYLKDFLRLPEKDKIFLTRWWSKAL